MQFRPLGTTGDLVPVVGQGTWKLEQADTRRAERAILTGLDEGMTHIDTAEDYADGAVEELLGRILSGRRDTVFLTSKVRPDHATATGTVSACQDSCRRLRTDRLDLYLLHWPGRAPLEETVEAFRDLQKAGAIRHWGVSNFNVQHLDRLVRCAERTEIACNQVLYHLADRSIEHRVRPWTKSRLLTTIGYSPFGSGAFPPPDHRGVEVLGKVAEEHGATRHQIALAFLARHDDVLLVPRSFRPEHIVENARAVGVSLTRDDYAALTAAFPPPPDDGSLPTI